MTRHSSIRLSLIAAAASLAVYAMPVTVFAQAETDPALKEVENSKFSTSGLIASNAVYIRCGPGDNYYPTMKLDKGAKVKVVGAKFDWLKVVPPDGSFCYVARLYVDRHGNGSVGRVNKDSINVRAGSTLSALKIGILCELSQGEDVEILGEEQEYFKIKPPARAYLYVNKKFVEPDPDAKPEAQVAKTDAPKVDAPKPEAPKVDAPKPEAVAKADPAPGPDFAGGDTAKSDAPKADTVKPDAPKPETVAKVDEPKPEMTKTGGPKADVPDSIPLVDTIKSEATTAKETPKPEGTTPEAPKAADVAKVDAPKTDTVKPEAPKVDPLSTPEGAEAAFDKAETAFLAARVQPLEQQPLPDLVKQFEGISKSDALPESMRRVAESRLATLKVRAVAQAELVKFKQSQDAMKQRQVALEAEQQELQKRIAENSVKVFVAVGTLQPSSLQQGAVTLYRITDPATGRTVCYLRSNDPKTVNQIGQFVGVKGSLQEEARLGARVITPSEITQCDPAKVHQTITAQIIPPSLMPREPAQAATDPQPTQP